MFQKICVFCGSSFGQDKAYLTAVKQFAEALIVNEINLVYGGGNAGLMGELARSVLEKKGEVVGVIPKKIHENVEHVELTELFIVDDMHQRKAKMYELADGFVALPGGIGTIEELAEALTWQQIGYHQKPIGILNVNHFYDKLLSLLDHMKTEGFIKQDFLDNLIVSDDPEDLLHKMKKFKPNYINKWEKEDVSKNS
ncbi:TIGR00730 family Rossman fold protein [Halalkalibacter akibai]|uniref:Cytokinin riboside 5'-monophosphate phosphoribohydrolase n=1 Tax=Halalkalibacter akibai (strain ATCC 43226 / DSM 21942 / CIP 109018 / JCM 9157 / 1139) TaxID=1236973 RepID=W4QRV0_HALA3|nr:TIGR00730 family Rossman fold protein [Halalkalibacter akibai]GAE34368.1 lysine decarboxylase family [Halalkalibacter akibai JCM 9157]